MKPGSGQFRSRRVFVIGARRDERPLTKPIPDVRLERWKLLKVPTTDLPGAAGQRRSRVEIRLFAGALGRRSGGADNGPL
jgi:hypothetical protein